MNHKAIYKLYPSVDHIIGNEAFDSNNNVVPIDMAYVKAWVDPDQYKYNRAAAYPSIPDQLDQIFHEGLDAWKATIQSVKDTYPKGGS